MGWHDDTWWRGAVIYQIYPRSFADSNGDGVGDLAGITQHLDHVASLGVDGIWISPFFRSPMRDFGYDVQDHCAIDPLFGNLHDFDRLVARAHALQLKVIIDMVWSHTAALHPWFEQSRQSRDNAFADWYVWADAKPDGSPPNNWQSWMGGPTWTWDTRRRQYYLHNFLPQMPDLNLHHVAVQDALLAVGRFWLERGVDGFRLDTANYYCHDPALTDNPPQSPDRCGEVPAAMQRHLHNICQPQTLPFLERIRQLTDGYGARMTVAEIGSEHNLERMLQYTQGVRRLHTAYSFVLLGEAPTPHELAALLQAWQDDPAASSDEADEALGWPSWALSNHDAVRVATRWAQGDAQRVRQCLALLLCLRGSVFLYQGEELGLEQSVLAWEDLQDPVGKAHWPRNPGRDGCRTPMPWQAQAPFAGFSAVRPWLPADAAHARCAVDVQEADPDSCLHWTRRLLRLRRAHPALRSGRFVLLHADETLLAFVRSSADSTDSAVLCAFNLGAAESVLQGAGQAPDALLRGLGDGLILGAVARSGGDTLRLGPWSALIQPLSRQTKGI